MAFVYEEITREEDVKYFDELGLKNPINKSQIRAVTSEKYGFKKEWMIDREKDVFIVALGGGGSRGSEFPMYYAMVFTTKRKIVKFSTISGGTGNNFDGKNIWWEVNIYQLPYEYRTDRSIMLEIYEMIKEALYEEEKNIGKNILSTKFDIYEGEDRYGF